MQYMMMLFINKRICSISQNMRKHYCFYTAAFVSMNAKRHTLAASLRACASGAGNNKHGIFSLICHYSSMTYTAWWCIASMLQKSLVNFCTLMSAIVMTFNIEKLDSFSGGERGWVYCAAAGTQNVLRI